MDKNNELPKGVPPEIIAGLFLLNVMALALAVASVVFGW